MEQTTHRAEGHFRTCGACGALYHTRELYPGRGRHLDEHPDHDHAPCGHSQDWFGSSSFEIEPEPAIGLEFFEEEE